MTGNNAAVKYAVTVFTILAVILFAAAGVYADQPEFRIDMDSLNLQSGVSCSLTVSMLNAQDAKVTEIKGLENFDVMSTGQSISTQIVNGKISMTKEIKYIIMPKATGHFTLQGVIEYDGKTYLTNQLEVNVSQGAHYLTLRRFKTCSCVLSFRMTRCISDKRSCWNMNCIRAIILKISVLPKILK